MLPCQDPTIVKLLKLELAALVVDIANTVEASTIEAYTVEASVVSTSAIATVSPYWAATLVVNCRTVIDSSS